MFAISMPIIVGGDKGGKNELVAKLRVAFYSVLVSGQKGSIIPPRGVSDNIPNQNRYEGHIWWWIIWLLVSMVVIMNADIPRTVVTILGYGVSVDVIAAFILGLVASMLIRLWNRRHYPSRLFKTRSSPNRYVYKESIGKPLIFRFHKSGDGHGFHFFIESKRIVDDIERIGIRPQVKISWLRSCLKGYNSKTRNIDSDERDNPPIRIVDVKDVTHSGQIPQKVIDDGACGKWLHYAPVIKMKPNSEMVFWIEIQANKPWKGYIDFRLNTSEGRRVAHHPYELIRIRS